jgi:hypothetical protein
MWTETTQDTRHIILKIVFNISSYYSETPLNTVKITA